jgi:membrane protease YdiL (CAAX protease family)
VKWLAIERVGLGVVLVVGLAFASGHGVAGYAALFVGVAALGAVIGLVGRRYPMIYAQNRRDRRRRR